MPRFPQYTPGADNGSFIRKPPTGWLHPDDLLRGDGIIYAVRYIGCQEINTSMRSLDFETRSNLAKESICRICELAGLKTPDKRKKVDKRVCRMLATVPNMELAGSNINLSITSSSLSMVVMETGQVIAQHSMPNISFASGGDIDTLDFVAYVAKDEAYGRACFVLECGGGLAQDVITTIGQAFDLRFKEFLNHSPQMVVPLNGATPRDDTIEYYNDLPGKVPPDMPPPVPPLPATMTSDKSKPSTKPAGNPVLENLIDLGSDVAGAAAAACPIKSAEHNYINDIVCNPLSKDPFDMQPFEQSLPHPVLPPPPPRRPKAGLATMPKGAPSSSSATPAPSQSVLAHKSELLKEVWFHGPISRKESEGLVAKDGDFLVRESQGSAGQFVLTGMQGGSRKHLLLVDPEGVVRTKDKTFESVSHLINYHCNNELPIISAESTLILKFPVARTKMPR